MIETLLKKVRAANPEADVELIRQAWEFAQQAHEGQSRLTGEPYITHPLAAAEILADLGMDEATIAAALLHDVVEDTGTPSASIKANFGDTIASLVEGVTKISRIDFAAGKARQAENLRRMLLAMSRDLRVIVIKLADRLHNLRTLKPLPPDRRRAVAEETLHIFAPLAHRLGLGKIKWELEDLSLRYLDPKAYSRIVRLVAKSREEREGRVKTIIQELSARLAQSGIEAEVSGRPKHFYSIYLKMKSQGVDFEQIMDLEAIRIIVKTVPDCYTALGVVHSTWLPIPDMFTDYIAKPKPNLYRSLHTKVVGPDGYPLEVQIRTEEMHHTAEYGIAAHWLYKEGGRLKETDEKLAWLRRLLEHHTDFTDPSEWLESLKLDLFKDQVFVFTPEGDVIDLPAGATPIDFAYRIHTQIGHNCVGAKVNGKLVPLNYVFKNGDVAEILTAKSSRGPSLDWLSFVTTATAKSRIKSWFRRQNREENIESGRQMLEAECRRHALNPSEILTEANLAPMAERMRYSNYEDLIAAVGFGEISAEAIVRRITGRFQAHAAPPETAAPTQQRALPLGISAPGSEGMLFRLSRCCCPVPGDAIMGYVTRGRGVTVHREDCSNLASYKKREPERLMQVSWGQSGTSSFPIQIEIEAMDRVGLLNDITNILSASETNIRSARVRTKKPCLALVSLMVDIHDLEHLNRLMRDIASMPDILRVYRLKSA